MKESFVIHTEWIEDLPEDYKMQFLMYIYDYGANGTTPEVNGLEKTLWTKIQRRMDEDQAKWEESKQRRSYAGKRGAVRRWEPKTEPEQPVEQKPAEETAKAETAAPAPKKRLEKPTVEEVKAYCEERGNSINAEKFVAHYESNGWKVGRNPMKDWKAAVRSWEQRDKQPYGYTSTESLPEDRMML